MPRSCKTTRYAIQLADLPRLAQQLGYRRLSRRIGVYPRGMAGRRFARLLAIAAAAGRHLEHSTASVCRRASRLDSVDVVLLTVPRAGRGHHIIRSARAAELRSAAPSPEVAEAEALFDRLIG
jgi:hypothetical protein